MAFNIKRFAGWTASLGTTLAASIAIAQVATQPAATPSYPNQPYPAAGTTYVGQPAGARAAAAQPAAQGAPQRFANQASAAPPSAYAAPNGYAQPAANAQPAAYGQPNNYAQPAAYAQPQQGAAAGAPAADAYAQPARAAGNVRPVQYEQPLAPSTAGVVAQPVSQPVAQPVAAQDSPTYRATEVSAVPQQLPNTLPADVAGVQQPQEHPLMPALRWAKQGLEKFNQVQDYSCTLVKRERIDGVLGEHEYIFVKVRHRPFSVYTYFLAPAKVKGQEAIYVDGQNDGSLLAHPNGIRHKLIGTVSLKPTSALAMSGNRYPITEMGIRRLLERLVEVGTNDVKYGECNVTWLQGVKVNDRICTRIAVEHPTPRRNFIFHKALIYVDDEAQLPIRYEAYDWPAPGTKEPQLTEEYTFLNVKLNNGFTDADFSPDNAKYGFK